MSNRLIDTTCALKNPTVKETIDYLSQFPPDMPFRIEDPDTNWTVNIVHASQSGGIVWLTGQYDEMNTGPEGCVR